MLLHDENKILKNICFVAIVSAVVIYTGIVFSSCYLGKCIV